MAYVNPTIANFKGFFVRDFPYAQPGYGGAGLATVVSGVITSVAVKNAGASYLIPPTVTIQDPTGVNAVVTCSTGAGGSITAFQVVTGGTGYTNPTVVITGGGGDATNPGKVQDSDINTGFAIAYVNINPGQFQTQDLYTMGYLYLSAHYMVINLRNSMQGVASKYNWLSSNRSVGSVNESYDIPERVRKSPILSQLSSTTYGAQYLTLVLPQLIGNYATFHRYTLP
jgi:hypothetical protein